MMLKPPPPTFAKSRDEIKSMASAVAADLRKAAEAVRGEPASPTGGGSRQRALPEDLRQRFINVRTALVERGIFDQVLARFDTAAAPQETTLEIADELAKVASTL